MRQEMGKPRPETKMIRNAFNVWMPVQTRNEKPIDFEWIRYTKVSMTTVVIQPTDDPRSWGETYKPRQPKPQATSSKRPRGRPRKAR